MNVMWLRTQMGRLFQRELWLGLLVLSLCAALACTVGGECSTNADCGGSQVCVESTCKFVGFGDGNVVSEPTTATDGKSTEPNKDTEPNQNAEPGKEPPPSPDTDASEKGTGEPPGESTAGEVSSDAGEFIPPPDDENTEDPGQETDAVGCVNGYTRPCYSGPANTMDVGVCVAGQQTCVDGLWDPECKGEILPSQEICDGKDNNCDGKVDESFPEQGGSCQVQGKKGPCAQGQSACQQGQLKCEQTHQPQPEDCSNQIDDDCDGLVDGPPCQCNPGETRECYTGNPSTTANVGECIKGKQTCDSNGKWGTCQGEITPVAESCDGKDNDCDGQVDETFPEKGQSCTDSSKKGECQRGAYSSCSNGQLQCSSQVKPITEICGNGKDDDCDGSIDENPPCQCKSGQTRTCYSGAPGTDRYAPCKRGTQTCTSNGTWGSCAGEVVPKTESCDNADNDCNGKVDDNLVRNCSNACGRGTETCSAGKWVNCSAPIAKPEICDNKDNNCNGKVDEGLTQSCSNQCGRGTETCSAGKWVNCSAPTAKTEVCDGKDNDCDGQVDEGNPGGGASCTVSGQRGECAKGKISCVSARLTCIQVNKPSTEVCNKLDDDCDGQVDESDPNLNKACTITANKGECRRGVYACNGSLYCRQTVQPRTEICRNSRDDDCDGRIDEICGITYPYAIANSNGTFSYQRGFSQLAKPGTGYYRYTASSSAYGCTARPIFIAARSSAMRPISYYCNGSSFDVRIGSHAPRTTPVSLNDVTHNVVLPHATGGAAYGLYSCTFTGGFPPKLTCGVSRSYGSPTVTKISTGVYDIGFAGCNSVAQPVFVSLYGTTPSGYGVGYYLTSGKCRVRTYDLAGTLADRYFAFWIPNRTNAAYAIISSSGTVYASNNFGDTAKWTAIQNKDTSGNPVSTDVKFATWNSRSAVFVNPRIGTPYYTSPIPLSDGARVYTRKIADASYSSTYFSILFVQ